MAEKPSPTTNPEQNDPLAKALGPSDIEIFLEQNKGRLLLALGTLIVVAVGTIIVVSQREASRLQAAQSFTSATTLAELNQVIDRESGNVDGGNALLRKAALLEAEGKKEEARTALIEFRNRYPEHPLLAQALVVLGQMAENGGDRGKARDFYQQVPATSGMAPLARMRLADLMFQEGRLAEAREAYSEVEREFSENPWASQLQDRIKEVNLQLNKPEWPQVTLEKPEPPPAPSPAPAPNAGAKPTDAKPGASAKGAEMKAAAPGPAKPAAPKPPVPANSTGSKPVESKPAVPAKPAAPAGTNSPPAPKPASESGSKPAPK